MRGGTFCFASLDSEDQGSVLKYPSEDFIAVLGLQGGPLPSERIFTQDLPVFDHDTT